jgi:hypothetical protein
MKNWAENQVGADQVVGMVECLWHDVNIYLPDGSEELMNSARRLSEDLRPSNAFTLDELRVYAVQLMRGDEEFQLTMSCVSGLFDRLVDIVQMP